MFIRHHYSLPRMLQWSRREWQLPLVWALLVTCGYELLGLRWLVIPTLPMSLIGIAVAFYLGFKNNASYDRLWEARKIWGAIVNASRSWAYSARDLVSDVYGGQATQEELDGIRKTLVYRHIAWMDALRFQLRKLKTWEHDDAFHQEVRKSTKLPELEEEVSTFLGARLEEEEVQEVLSKINPAAQLLAHQSKHLAELRQRGLLDGFSHMELQGLLQELMTQQGKAERIKNFPLPRQYATVNFFFAALFALALPFGLLPQFAELSAKLKLNVIWLNIPFSAIVGWVFLTTDKIGEWSENPFEGLSNDVPITSMVRGIERDILQMIGETELPEARTDEGGVLY